MSVCSSSVAGAQDGLDYEAKQLARLIAGAGEKLLSPKEVAKRLASP